MNIFHLLQSVYEQVQYNIFRVSMILNANLPQLQLIESTLFFMQTENKNDYSTGPGPVDLAKKKTPKMILIFVKYLCWCIFFQNILKLFFCVQSVEAFKQDGRRNGQIRVLGSSF